MDRLLVATDLSTRADRALGRAARIAAEHGAEIHVLYVFDHALPERLAAKIETEARGELERLVHVAIGKRQVQATLHVEQGDPSTDVHDKAREVDAELIVLGLHRARPLIDIFRETTLERLVRLSHKPILVVSDPPDRPYKKALAALDFSPGSTRAAELTKRFFPRVTIRGFHAVFVPFQGLVGKAGRAADARFYLKEAEALLATWGKEPGNAALAADTEVAEGSMLEVLARQISRHKPDLLALGAHGRTGKAPLLLGSFANDMMRDPPCDLLISRP